MVNLKNILLNHTRHWVREEGATSIILWVKKPPLCLKIYYALNLILGYYVCVVILPEADGSPSDDDDGWFDVENVKEKVWQKLSSRQ